MTWRLVYTTSARGDMRDIMQFIARQSGSRLMAENFVTQLIGRCRKLSLLPGVLGTGRPELRVDMRSMPCCGYIIFFRYRPDIVEIVAILHASRDIEHHFLEV